MFGDVVVMGEEILNKESEITAEELAEGFCSEARAGFINRIKEDRKKRRTINLSVREWHLIEIALKIAINNFENINNNWDRKPSMIAVFKEKKELLRKLEEFKMHQCLLKEGL